MVTTHLTAKGDSLQAQSNSRRVRNTRAQLRQAQVVAPQKWVVDNGNGIAIRTDSLSNAVECIEQQGLPRTCLYMASPAAFVLRNLDPATAQATHGQVLPPSPREIDDGDSSIVTTYFVMLDGECELATTFKAQADKFVETYNSHKAAASPAAEVREVAVVVS